MDQQQSYLKNIPKVYWLNAIWSLLIIMPIIVPFFESRGLDMENVYQLQAIFAFGTLIFEIPSGYVSDLFGRKRTLILASLFHGLGFSIFAFADGFALLCVAEIVLALAVSLYSGTDIAMIYDSLAASNTKKAPIKMIGRQVFYRNSGEAIGGLLGGWLVLMSIDTVVWVNAAVSWLPVFFVLGMKEPPRHKMDQRKHWDNIKYVYNSVFRHSALLSLIVLNIVFYFVATLVAVWAFQKYWTELGIPLIYFGYLWALSNITVAIVGRSAHKLEKRVGSTAIVVTIGVLPIIGYLGMAWVEAFWGVLFCFLFQITRGLNSVVLRDGLNKRISADLRATANSITGLGVRGLFMFLGPAIGYLIDQQSFSRAMSSMGYAYLAIFVLALLPLLLQRRNYAPINH